MRNNKEYISITLAAGNGTRMRSKMPKPLHKIAGISLLDSSCKCVDMAVKKILVASNDLIFFDKTLENRFEIVIQKEKLGTGHAVLSCIDKIPDSVNVVINYGDTPFVKPETVEKMLAKISDFDCVFLGFEVKDINQKYGRLITDGEKLKEIVEYKDANPAQKAITLCNSGIIAVKSDILKKALVKIENKNASGEYYLTDIAKIINQDNGKCSFVKCEESEVMGINSRVELAEAEKFYQKILRNKHMEAGVTLINPKTVYFSHDTKIEQDVVIEENVHIGLNVEIHEGVLIKAFSYLENCKIGKNCIIGPFARIRPGTTLDENVRIGNFVEVKNSQIGNNTKINHLTYIGDSEIGENTNIGAGTITANHDGFKKQRTKIGKNCSIGIGTYTIAPIEIEDNAMTAAGSVITKNVSNGCLGIARQKQINIDGFVEKYKKKIRNKDEK
ncbi:bifunctional UDP-N-acetylglucosamine diphosphorylase/glucosamine-1-phosphate N-acetyltransferase GlmU [Candidatus Deianiraea vastatrix]|nr:bifunctional UDP-N-acetylglucosamine diphosphorylase/glucosamine-1-phosphate N-acetyltransferase GlmU [Candidatus Deianiraea vastatrix]